MYGFGYLEFIGDIWPDRFKINCLEFKIKCLEFPAIELIKMIVRRIDNKIVIKIIFYLYDSLSESLSFSLSVSLFLFIRIYLSLCLYLSFSLSVSLFLFVCLSLFFGCLSLSLFVYLSLSIFSPLSLFLSSLSCENTQQLYYIHKCNRIENFIKQSQSGSSLKIKQGSPRLSIIYIKIRMFIWFCLLYSSFVEETHIMMYV